MTSGLSRPVLVRAYAVIVFLIALNGGINVLTSLDDARRFGRVLKPAEVISWEFSSAIAVLAASVVIYWALRIGPLARGGLLRAALVHAGASVLFSAAHVTGMVLLRVAIYAAAGSQYRFGIANWPYEYRKDLVAYIALGGVLWVAGRLSRPPERAERTEAPPVPTFDIRDSRSIFRTPVRDILAARAAGNYVEFFLADGSRPLMRAALGKIEAALEAHGFVRTHRSWIVNAERVRIIRAAGSGDFRIEIDGGVSAPLSRRFPGAMMRLKAGAEAPPA